MIDQSLEWCTYRTEFADGHYYLGKGKTAAVLSGKYTGSGVRYSLAVYWDCKVFGQSTVTTKVLATFPSEDEAYDAEALLVPLSLLADRFCLNSTEGGRKGKFRNHSTLLKSIKAEHKREGRASKAEAAKIKKIIAAEKLKKLKAENKTLRKTK